MKKAIVFTSLLLSISAQAATYSCVGLDAGGLVTIEAGAGVLNDLGTLNGAKVQLLDENNGYVTMTIKQNNLVTAIVAKSGLITFHQNNGSSVHSVTCLGPK